MTWLVTGGAGYIGSHVVRAFGQVGLSTVVLDDLSSGHKDFVPDDVPLVQGSILDTDLVADTLSQHGVVGVVHLAGFKYAGVSVSRPLHTYEQNVTGTVHLLEAMAVAGCRRDRVLLVGGGLRHAGRRPGHRGDPDPPRVALRRVQAHRRVAPGRPGARHRAAAHVAAVLQRGRLGHRRPLRHQPAQPLPAGPRRPGRGPHAAHQRRPTTRRPTAPACATTSTSPTSPRPTSRLRRRSRRAAARARLQPGLRRRRLRPRDHDRRSRRPPGSPSSPSSRPAAPATRPGSSRPASSPRATSTGRCATPCSTW